VLERLRAGDDLLVHETAHELEQLQLVVGQSLGVLQASHTPEYVEPRLESGSSRAVSLPTADSCSCSLGPWKSVLPDELAFLGEHLA
jgi:hypothetical protein